MNGVLLDPITGRPTDPLPELVGIDGRPIRESKNADGGWQECGRSRVWMPEGRELPASVAEYLEKSRAEAELHDKGVTEGFYAPPMMNSLASWEEVLYAPIADGTAVTAAAETIMVPNYTLPANYFIPGRTVRYMLFGRLSTVITTPGTITTRLRYGGVAGVALAAGGAYAPDSTAASTNLTFWVEWWAVCRSAGTTGTVMCCGRQFLNDMDDASVAAAVANTAMSVMPVSAPATATIDTTVASALSPTWTQSVATGSMTVHLAVLESMN